MNPKLIKMPINEIQPTPWFWWTGQKIGIVSDDPGGPKAMTDHPELEAKTLAEWKAEQFDG